MLNSTPNLEYIEKAFKIIFSWFVLMPIAVIISGKLLAQPFKLPVENKQYFIVPIPKILRLHASDAEVVLGFVGFFLTLVAIALAGGPQAYQLFRDRFGLDPGHFNSLCILSSFVTVVWAALLWFASTIFAKLRAELPDSVTKERDDLIRQISAHPNPDVEDENVE